MIDIQLIVSFMDYVLATGRLHFIYGGATFGLQKDYILFIPPGLPKWR